MEYTRLACESAHAGIGRKESMCLADTPSLTEFPPMTSGELLSVPRKNLHASTAFTVFVRVFYDMREALERPALRGERLGNCSTARIYTATGRRRLKSAATARMDVTTPSIEDVPVLRPTTQKPS